MQLGTTVPLPRDIDADLDRWLEPFLDATGRSTRRKMAPLYVRGLLGSGGRKSIQPMAERLGLSSHDQVHHFISSPAWDDAPLWRVLAEQVNREVGGEGALRGAAAGRDAAVPAICLDGRSAALRRGRRAGGGAHGADQARDRAGRDRPGA